MVESLIKFGPWQQLQLEIIKLVDFVRPNVVSTSKEPQRVEGR